MSVREEARRLRSFMQKQAILATANHRGVLLDPDLPDGWRMANVDGRYFVYVAYSHRVGNPIYVGYTANLFVRLSQHSIKPWWLLVDEIVVLNFSTEVEARAEEADFIESLVPVVNIQRNRRAYS